MEVIPTVKQEHFDRYQATLEKLITAFKTKDVRDKFEKWRSEASTIKEKLGDLPKMKVTVYGDTGVGKSSLLNALLDEPDLLSTDGYGDACTSAITMIETVRKTTGDSETPGFQADIIFLTKEELLKEMDVLKKDAEGDDDEQDEVVKEKALVILHTLFGKLDSTDNLKKLFEQRHDITQKLEQGKMKTKPHKKASELQKEIWKYMVETGEDQQYWPLVKQVLIQLLNPSELLQEIVFVDLPGVADSNLARVIKAEEEKESADVLLILTHIDRCKASVNVKSIVGEKMNRQLEMDQIKVLIVCTCTDEKLKPGRVHERMNESEKRQVEAMDKKINISKEEIDKLTREQDGGKKSSRIQTLEDQIQAQETSKDQLYLKARNKHMKEDLEKTTKTDVFCVSSMDYMKIANNNYKGDRKPKMFQEKEDTQIPKLRMFLQEAATKHQNKEIVIIQKQLQSVISDTSSYLLNFHTGRKRYPKVKLVQELGNLKTEFKKIEHEVEKAISEIYKEQLFPFLEEGIAAAEKAATVTVASWGKYKSGSKTQPRTGLPHNTYRATVIRDGYFESKTDKGKTKLTVDFNDDLASPLTERIVEQWQKVFSEDQWESLTKRKVKDPVTKIITEHSSRLQDIFGARNQALKDNVCRIRDDAILKLQYLRVFSDVVFKAHRSAHRCISKKLQKEMLETYESCALRSGKGSFDEMKRIMEADVERLKESMFKNTGLALRKRLQKILTDVCTNVNSFLMKIHTEFSEQMDPLWMKHEAEMFPETQVYDEVQEDLRILKEQLKAAESPGPIDQTEKRKSSHKGGAEVPKEKPKAGPSEKRKRILRSDDAPAKKQRMDYAKVTSDKEMVQVMDKLVEAAHSVGLIGSSGTGFKVGDKYIMTASHVFAAALGFDYKEITSDIIYQDLIGGGLGKGNLSIRFYDKDTNSRSEFCIRNLKYVSMNLDVAVAELEGDSTHIKSFSRFCDTKGQKKTFHFLGHDNATINQFRDPYCETLTRSEGRTIKIELLKKGLQEKNLKRYDDIGCSTEFVHFHCSFKHGGSGSPGLCVPSGGEVSVLTMLRAGYPDVDLPFPNDGIRVRYPQLCVEEGVKMKAVMERMKMDNQDLCLEIFNRYGEAQDCLWYV